MLSHHLSEWKNKHARSPHQNQMLNNFVNKLNLYWNNFILIYTNRGVGKKRAPLYIYYIYNTDNINRKKQIKQQDFSKDKNNIAE